MNKGLLSMLALSVCAWLASGHDEAADCAGPDCSRALDAAGASALPTEPYAGFIDLAGQLHLLRRDAAGRIGEGVWGAGGTLVNGIAQPPQVMADGRRVLAGGQHEFFLMSGAGLVRGPELGADAEHRSIGLGFSAGPVRPAALAGRHRVLGHVCAHDGSACAVTHGSLSIGEEGRVDYCPAAGNAAACAGGLSDRLPDERSDTGWRTALGGRLLADAGAGMLVYTVDRPGRGRYVLHAVREDAARIGPAPASRYVIADGGGDRLEPTPHPPFEGWALTADVPSSGLAGDADGNAVLASTSGVVVYWRAGRGLGLAAPL